VVGILLILGLVGALLFGAMLTGAPLARAAAPSPPRAVAAEVSVGEEVIERCTHGESVAGFTLAQYREALQLATSGPNSSELEEYSSCVSIIKHAERNAARQGGPGSSEGGGAAGGSSSTPPPGSEGIGAARALPLSQGEQHQIDAAVSNGSAPLRLGGRVVHPGAIDTHAGATLADLPTPLKVVLAFIAAGALATLGYTLRNPLRARLGFLRGKGTGGNPGQ